MVRYLANVIETPNLPKNLPSHMQKFINLVKNFQWIPIHPNRCSFVGGGGRFPKTQSHHSKKSPTVGPTERTPKKTPAYLIARSQLPERGPLVRFHSICDGTIFQGRFLSPVGDNFANLSFPTQPPGLTASTCEPRKLGSEWQQSWDVRIS